MTVPPTRIKVIAKPSEQDLRLADLTKNGKRFVGKSEYQKILRGEHVTPRQRIIAMCYECMGWYQDGTEDCQQSTCPLYGMMPYRQKRRSSNDSDGEIEERTK